MSEPIDNYEFCREMISNDDRDRYLISLFAPSGAQKALWALWAFNQEVAKIRENISEPMMGEIRLQWWVDAVDELAKGDFREHPVCMALHEAALPIEIFSLFKETMAARKLDIFDEGPADFAALALYADGVGGALQEAAYRISIDNKVSEQGIICARALGQAWSMLGLVRALPFHWQAGRSYMPENAKSAMDITDPKLAFEQLKPIIDRMCNYANEKLKEVALVKKSLSKLEQSTLLSGALLTLQTEILERCDNNPFETPPFEAGDLKKIWRLYKAKIFSW